MAMKREVDPNYQPWLRRLLAGLSSRRSGFTLGSNSMEFVVDNVGLGQDFIRVLRLSPANIIQTGLSTPIHHVQCKQ